MMSYHQPSITEGDLFSKKQIEKQTSFDIYGVHTVEVNPLFDENAVTVVLPDEIIFEPDEDDVVLQIIELIHHDDCDSFDSIIEQVKGLPIHGRMLMIPETKREEFVRKIKHKAPEEVVNVISRLRKVNRNSISRSSTVVTKIRAQMRWNAFAEKITATIT